MTVQYVTSDNKPLYTNQDASAPPNKGETATLPTDHGPLRVLVRHVHTDYTSTLVKVTTNISSNEIG